MPLDRESRAAAGHYPAGAVLGQLLHGLGDPVLVTDGEGRFLDANPAACSLLGYAREELLRLSVPDVIVAAPGWAAAEFADFLARGSWEGDLALRRADGRLTTVEVRANAIPFQTGT